MKNQFQWMSVGFALACAGNAIASPIFFSNPAPGQPGHVDWAALGFLDITKPASQQTGSTGFGTFKFMIAETFDKVFNTLDVNGSITAGFGGRIFLENQPGVGVGFGLLQPGDLVGPGGVIPQGGGGTAYNDTFTGGVLTGSFLGAPLGESFLGVSFATAATPTMFTDFHFGWIGFNLFENPDGSHGLDVTRYGYETTLDTAIAVGAIPAPGALPLFAAAALFTARRRRDTDR